MLTLVLISFVYVAVLHFSFNPYGVVRFQIVSLIPIWNNSMLYLGVGKKFRKYQHAN